MMFKLSCLGDLWKKKIFRQKVKLDLYQASPYNKTQTRQTQTMTMWLTFITNCNIWREINIAKYGKIFFQSYNFQSLVVSAVPCRLIANTLARVRESRLFLLPPQKKKSTLLLTLKYPCVSVSYISDHWKKSILYRDEHVVDFKSKLQFKALELANHKNCNYFTYHTTCFIQFETYSVYEVLQMLCSTSSPIKSHL